MIAFEIDGAAYSVNLYSQIEDIYLFGSYARNEQDKYSDIDLLVIIQRCDENEYIQLKKNLSKQLNMPQEWISIYQKDKILEMQAKGSYFLWHIKLEGKILYSKQKFLEKVLENLPEYTGAEQDLEDYDIICNDIEQSLDDEYLDIIYELSVLASIIRNTAIAIDFLCGRKVFGRITAIVECNDIMKGKIYIPIDEYVMLYYNRLYETRKTSYYPHNMSLRDVYTWLYRAKKIIALAKEVVNNE